MLGPVHSVKEEVHMSTFALDRSNPFQVSAADRLTTEPVGWLVTVDADGTPQPSPVWFVWDGADTVLIYSQETKKVRNIEARPRVALHFNDGDDAKGPGSVVAFTGSAVIDRSHPVVLDNQSYLDKYANGITGIGMTNESFSAEYHVPVIMRLEKLRGH
jgi:PPOX class probable F420-dependent enzyme